MVTKIKAYGSASERKAPKRTPWCCDQCNIAVLDDRLRCPRCGKAEDEEK